MINFLNTEKFLTEAIESILAQKYKNWELLLVDDGSSDKSTDIAQQFARRYPGRIHYLEHDDHQNRGTSASRNLGINHARGKYIAFLDADDIWLPHKLARQVPILESRPEAGMIYGSLYYWYSWTGNPEDDAKDHEAEIRNFPSGTMLHAAKYLSLFLREKIVIPSPTCLLVRREVVEKIGAFEEDFRGLFDDQVFVVKMSLAAPVVVLKGYFEKWRRHENSMTFISENITGEGDKMKVVYLKWVQQYLLHLGITDLRLWLAVRKELLIYQSPPLLYLSRRLVSCKDQIKSILRIN